VAWRLARACRAHRIEVLHAHQYTPFFYAACARLLQWSGPRLILTEHGRHYPDIVSPRRRALNRLLLDGQADAVNAVCAFSARALNQVDGFAGRRIQVIANGIDLDRYRPAADKSAARRRLGLDPGRRLIACVARFHSVKDHGTLISAFSDLASGISDVDLLLVGDGPLRGEMERRVAALGLEQRVHFLGIRSDVPEILPAADLFTLLSVSEAASLTLLEAMACALPTVVTAVGGNPEMVRAEREGVLVPRGDAKAAAAAFRRLLEEPDQAARLGAAGRARVEACYQLADTVRTYGDLYGRLTGC
jgi:glycosyltransferase involved in cell wall biosynthesis